MKLLKQGMFSLTNLKVPKYLINQNLYNLQTEVIHSQIVNNFLQIQFRDTIIHPQGGGQPDDKAWLKFKNNEQKIPILKSIKNSHSDQVPICLSNKILYLIQVTSLTQTIKNNRDVQIVIDKQHRTKMMKLHTGGHLIDYAMKLLFNSLQYGKCGHFPDNPFVQYNVNKSEMTWSVSELKQKLQLKIDQLIQSKIQIQKLILTLDQALSKQVISEINQSKGSNFVRVVKIGDSECCCGGTHLKNTYELKQQLKIKKITNKQKTPSKVKIDYQV